VKTYRSNVFLAWGIFTSIIVIELAMDYLLRQMAGDFLTGGFSEFYWFAIQIIAALLGSYFIISGLFLLKTPWHKILHLSGHICLGGLFYIVTVYSYIIGLGIDSF